MDGSDGCMKVDEFLANRDPGDETEHVEVTDPDFQHVTSLTPSGIECLYSWAPKRLYRLRWAGTDAYRAGVSPPNNIGWEDVPSVTSVLGILDKSGALTWWGMKVGVQGVLDLINSEDLYYRDHVKPNALITQEPAEATVDDVVDLLTYRKLTVNHVKDKAADRGVNVHSSLEAWTVDQSYRGNPDLYEEHERGYIVGLNKFLDDLGAVEGVQAEVMVGSLEYGYAGRYDLRLFLPERKELVTKTYPKRADKRELVNDGHVLIDLKTSKDCYSSHSLQLAAYEQASIECGYGSTDYRAVLRVTADGKYEFRRANAEFSDFKAVLTAYTAMQRKAWFS